MLVKFTVRPLGDLTNEIHFGEGRVAVFNGDPVEVSPEELARVHANGYLLTKFEEVEEDVEQVVDDTMTDAQRIGQQLAKDAQAVEGEVAADAKQVSSEVVSDVRHVTDNPAPRPPAGVPPSPSTTPAQSA
jgi:hypothetical protein